MQQTDLLNILEYINPAALDYQDWVNVGMALKHEGYTCNVWDDWSMADSRYHKGECYKKWNTFNGSSEPVTAGTIVQLAKDNGWIPEHDPGHELGWNDEILKEELVIVDKNWIEEKEIIHPTVWNPVSELIKYLEILFDSTENVGFVTQAYEKEERFLPTKGVWDRTAGQLIQSLLKCKGDVCNVIGDYNQRAGAWIRFNPLDGKGCKNENVTDFKYALVESDTMEIEKQNAIIRELELPVACLVHSGGKSLHAVVRVDASDYNEYRKRVNYLYDVCQKNGLKIDSQNRNPSRLSRMPGIIRDGNKQFIVDTNIGKENWNEWYEWIEGVNDDLPEPEMLESVWDDLPQLSPSLIDGVLRQGHKMLIAGPSKAGKSFALIEMCIAIAEGRKWLDFDCAKGKVMYVNLELDRASCLHRFKDVYESLGWAPDNLNHIDIWNLRGKSIPMDKLAPKLIRRAAKKNYIAIIIDPIYKVITGDENSADQMANFCNQFDKVCTELGCAVIYCHHHSKGSQGGKRSMDRASGSGVFARDPDALIDLIELEVTEDLLKYKEDKAICNACFDYLNEYFEDWEDDVSQDDMCSRSVMTAFCKKKLSKGQYNTLEGILEAVKKKVHNMTAWRIEGTLREFPKFPPVNIWFDYPVHTIETTGVLSDVEPEGEKFSYYGKKKDNRTPEQKKEDNKEERSERLRIAFEALDMDGTGVVKRNDIVEYLKTTRQSVDRHIKESGIFQIDNGLVSRV